MWISWPRTVGLEFRRPSGVPSIFKRFFISWIKNFLKTQGILFATRAGVGHPNPTPLFSFDPFDQRIDKEFAARRRAFVVGGVVVPSSPLFVSSEFTEGCGIRPISATSGLGRGS